MNRIKFKCSSILLLLLILQSLTCSTATEEERGVKTLNVNTKSKFQRSTETFKTSVTRLKKTHKKIDLVFLIDSSSSVGKSNFQSEIKFVKKVLADFTVSYNNTRVGIVTFSSAGKVVSPSFIRRYSIRLYIERNSTRNGGRCSVRRRFLSRQLFKAEATTTRRAPIPECMPEKLWNDRVGKRRGECRPWFGRLCVLKVGDTTW